MVGWLGGWWAGRAGQTPGLFHQEAAGLCKAPSQALQEIALGANCRIEGANVLAVHSLADSHNDDVAMLQL
jgi:hypothetical protein